MAWVGMGRVEYGRMTRSKERKRNDALRLSQVDRHLFEYMGTQEDTASFRTELLTRAQNQKGEGE